MSYVVMNTMQCDPLQLRDPQNPPSLKDQAIPAPQEDTGEGG